jgi:hypothetical protein
MCDLLNQPQQMELLTREDEPKQPVVVEKPKCGSNNSILVLPLRKGKRGPYFVKW